MIHVIEPVDLLLFSCVSGRMFQRGLGAYQLADYLRQYNYNVKVIDFSDEFTNSELEEIIDKYITLSTLAIGISTTFYSDFEFKFSSANKPFYSKIPDNIEHAVLYAKDKFPKVKIVIGGAKSLTAESWALADCIIHGYGEDKMLDYLNSLPNNKKHIPSKIFKLVPESGIPSKLVIMDEPLDKKFDITKLNHKFHKDDYIFKNETLPIEISRGCIFKCKFCSYPLTGKKKFDYLRDTELIRDELIYNYENFKTTNYFIGDDTFNDSTFKLERLHSMITQLPFKINFTCYLRLDLLHAHQEQIQLLNEMGLASPFFGIESLNQKSASTIGKGMKSTLVKDFLLELYYNHWKKEKPVTVSFIIGLPYESKSSVIETFEWLKTTELSPAFAPLTITANSIYQSEFQRNYGKYGYKFDPTTGYWENENFNFNEALELAEKFNSEIMYKNQRASAWFLFTLLNHDIMLEDGLKTNINDINWTKVYLNKKRKIKEYKKYILS